MEILAALYWTPGLLERFEEARGYSLVKYLPLLFTMTNSWGGSVPPYTETFAYGEYTADGTSIHNVDYRTTLNEGYQEYITHFVNWAHSKGLQYSNQPAYNLPMQMVSGIDWYMCKANNATVCRHPSG